MASLIARAVNKCQADQIEATFSRPTYQRVCPASATAQSRIRDQSSLDLFEGRDGGVMHELLAKDQS
ncbi:hypothetical protein ATY81_02395 [Rhizobium sp. R72]|nr:hypothetical protein ATY81_02395 [Rhizobium sp. R72]OWW05901.1 hypothetical protein ATY80_02395 [Rhizobium sp. R711]